MKRSQVLGLITEVYDAICIAGTHGKTSISTMTAHLLRNSSLGCTAFLGGISKNYETNFLWDENSKFAVVEADEFDRSFLTLKPRSALISSVDADHLDIYGNKENMTEAFISFTEKIVNEGSLVVKHGLPVKWRAKKSVYDFTYASHGEDAHFFADINYVDATGCYFDLVTPSEYIKDLKLGMPGLINIENAVGACAMALLQGVESDEIREALPTFKGIKRRFDIIVNTPELVYIDDYAHHPEEIKAALKSVRAIYPKHKLTVIFQPHLFTRTRDFYREFAESLSMADKLILTDIYPAREEPIEGVTSKLIGKMVKKIPVRYCSKNEIAENIKLKRKHVVVTMGAGDIDREVNVIKEKILNNV